MAEWKFLIKRWFYEFHLKCMHELYNHYTHISLHFIIFFIILSTFILFFFIKKTSYNKIRLYSFVNSIIIFFFSLTLVTKYSLNTFLKTNMYYQELIYTREGIPFFGVDGLSLCFIVLTTFIFPICFLIVWETKQHLKLICLCLMFLEIFLIFAFSSLDLLLFYVTFEISLIPMSIIILINGSRSRKIKATFYFFIYTLLSSLIMLFGIILVYYFLGSVNYFILQNALIFQTTIGLLLWPLFFLAFAVKIPMFPFHLWLPEAHVEASTEGSVILAALLLKLGGYGFLRILLLFFSSATIYYRPLVITLALLGILYSSLTLLRQIDMKRIIAYSSISHMNLAVLGLFSDTLEGILGGIYLLISHGFSSGALFFLVGTLYNRFHTRLLFNYGGLIQLMPKFCFFFFFFCLANFGFPGTANFIAESLILLILSELSFILFFFVGIGIFFSVIYSLLLYSRLMLGRLNFFFFNISTYIDLSRREFYICFYFFLVILIYGIHSSSITKLLSISLFFF